MAPTTVTEPATAPAALTAAPAPIDGWAGLRHISLPIAIETPIVGLTVRELFRLEKGSIVATAQSTETNVPVRAGGALIGWGEFQVVGEKLALRVAELA
jgi:flagellar motor switch/type III secretory pathway protein FliN